MPRAWHASATRRRRSRRSHCLESSFTPISYGAQVGLAPMRAVRAFTLGLLCFGGCCRRRAPVSPEEAEVERPLPPPPPPASEVQRNGPATGAATATVYFHQRIRGRRNQRRPNYVSVRKDGDVARLEIDGKRGRLTSKGSRSESAKSSAQARVGCASNWKACPRGNSTCAAASGATMGRPHTSKSTQPLTPGVSSTSARTLALPRVASASAFNGV